MDRETWCAAVRRVAKSQTWLSDWTEMREQEFKSLFISKSILLNPIRKSSNLVQLQLIHFSMATVVGLSWKAYPLSWCEIIHNVDLKIAQQESCAPRFSWDKMRTITQETAFQIALRNCSTEVGANVKIYVILVTGEYMQSSTYFFCRRFLSVLWSFLLVIRSSHHHEGF